MKKIKRGKPLSRKVSLHQELRTVPYRKLLLGVVDERDDRTGVLHVVDGFAVVAESVACLLYTSRCG